jgi:hypothetical protein
MQGQRALGCTDSDGDGVCDDLDNCPAIPNPNQGFPAKLNGTLVSGGDAFSFELSPDGATVVYVAAQDANDVVELYSVPIGGGTPVKLNGPLVAGGDMSD